MKKLAVLWAALMVTTFVWTAVGQVRTITLNPNYAGAPTVRAILTDAHGSLMMPLPVLERTHANEADSVWAFNGWFTTASGNPATMILPGASGTKFTANTTVYARWTAQRRPRMNEIPAAFKENFDWMRFERHDKGLPGYLNGQAERIYFNANGSVRQRNSLFHMIWEGGGTINWAVRWETSRPITLQERQNMARMLHESINVWARPLIGMPGWPFGEIPVTIVGWAVRNRNVIENPQPNEQIWVNSDHNSPFGDNNFAATRDYMASAPSNLSRFIQFGGSSRVNTTYNYPGGLHARFDMYQWCTQSFGGAVGGDWGNRASETRIIGYGTGVNATTGANTLNGVQTHEVGHTYGLYDLYGEAVRRPPNTSVPSPGGQTRFGQGDLRTVMDGTYNGPLNIYDQWQIRYYWDWLFSATPTNDRNRLFARVEPVANPQAPVTGVTTPMVARTATDSQFRFDNRGTLTYNLGDAQTASLKIYDTRGRMLKTMQLSGAQTSVNTNLSVAPQMLIWKVEAKGRVMDQGRMQFVSR
jgi:hypothetical protein